MPVKEIELSNRASDYPEALSTYKDGEPPIWRVLLWPHRSLPKGGFAFFIAMSSFLLVIPLLPLIGTMAFWGLLPFLVLTIAALWFFLMRSYRDGQLVEELSLWEDHMTLVRLNPRSSPEPERQDWSANPYWVTVTNHDQPVEDYLTLSGGPREVQLGTFLTPEERRSLKQTIEDKLRALPQNQHH